MAIAGSSGTPVERVAQGGGDFAGVVGKVGKAVLEADKVFLGEGVKLVPRRPKVSRGQSSVDLEVRLPKNAVVRRFDLRIQARKADAAAAGEVAQLRPAESRAGGAVLDFGLVRTVSGYDPPEGFEIREVYLWMGTGFAPNPHWTAGHPPKPGSVSARFDEARTERLLVVLDREATLAALAADSFVILPEAPADLELRIDGGAPVWAHAGPVIPGAGSEADAESFDREGERIVPLAAALAPLVGDPLGTGEVALRLSLSSRVPGLLALVDVTQEISTVSRAGLRLAGGLDGEGGEEGGDTRDLDFAGEGRIRLDLLLPPAPPKGRRVEEIRFTVAGSLGEDRTLDPVWPPEEAGEALAELVADPDHAFLVRLAPGRGGAPGIERLVELTGVRLPLLAGPGGAEARVALWRETAGAPSEPLQEGVSEPLTLDPPAPLGGAVPAWVTFPFKSPIRLEAGTVLWAALLAGRGSIAWRLAPAGLVEHPVRRGAATGPWVALPAVFAADPELARRTGAVRVTGRAAKESGLAPLQAGLEGGAGSDFLEVASSAKGARYTQTFTPARRVTSPRLAVTSRLAGRVTLREVDVVWRDPGA